MITVAEALARIGSLEPLGEESVPLAEAAGRVLSRPIRADMDWPPFDTSAMDGYAVRLADAAAPGATLAERPGLVAAGDPPPPPLGPGEAARVMTGAPLPGNAEAVIPVEQSHRDGGRVRFEIPAAPGAHLRHRGESIAAGSPLLSRGRRLAGTDLALAAMAGTDPVPVYRAPRITIAVTGNELVPVSQKPGPGQLRDSNGPMISALCAQRGWAAAAGRRVADDPAAVARLFAEAGRAEDLLITSGGVSAGDLDLLPAAAERAGFEILFHRVSLRPGKPVALGRRGATLWLGLPGNPVSAAVCFHLFGREAAARLEGDAEPGAPRITALLSRAVRAAGPRETYRDARWEIADGRNMLEPIASEGSHDLGAYARANALLRLPAGSPALAAGAVVEGVVIGEIGSRPAAAEAP